MKIAYINFSYGIGSTGNIVRCVEEYMSKLGHESVLVCSCLSHCSDMSKGVYGVKSHLGQNFSIIKTRFLGTHCFFDYRDTKKLVNWLENQKPDLVNIHNIHGFYMNAPLLFDYFKRTGVPVVWSLHDCWSFTGHCAYYDAIGCEKWKTGCNNCLQLDKYPITYIDRSNHNYKKKKELFCSLPKEQLSLTVTSNWHKKQVEQSYMSKYECNVVYNGIDIEKFRPVSSDFKGKYGLSGKKIVLCVSFGYNERKGILQLNELSSLLGEDYKIVIVGVGEEYRNKFSSDILLIPKTASQDELCKIYCAADVLFNPTQEDVFGLVNIESQSCGTPVVAYNTGGCPECVDSSTGIIVKKNDLNNAAKAIINICEDPIDNVGNNCREFVKENFTSEIMAEKYAKLFMNAGK